MLFKIKARKGGKDSVFSYDNELNVLTNEDGFVYEDKNIKFENLVESFAFYT